MNQPRPPARLPPAQLARTALAPAPLLAGVSGAALGFVLFPPFGVLIGLGTWGVGMAARAAGRRHRSKRPPNIDPFALHDPWRRHVQHALASQRRFDTAVAGFPDGPLRRRVGEAAGDLAGGVVACWQVAQRGEVLSRARRAIDTTKLRANLAATDDAEAPQGDARPPTDDVGARTRQALEAQLATAERLDASIADTRARLQLLDARLTEAVTRVVELAATGAAAEAGVDEAAGAIQGVSQELGALREALAELQHPPGEPGEPNGPDGPGELGVGGPP